MRHNIVAGNWKMNNNWQQTQILIEQILEQISKTSAEVMIAPPFTNLQIAAEMVKGTRLKVVAQNVHFEQSGAYTGEISVDMLKSIAVDTVIIGHSERRAYFGEKQDILAKKITTVLGAGMKAIFCIGEELEDRKTANHFNVVKQQLQSEAFHVVQNDWKQIVLAYEPVWAIGTGETASPEQAQEMHQFIRQTLAEKYNQDLAESVSILYGGSVKPNNAKEIFSKPDVDGGLIGGASLKATDFLNIAEAI